jgi:hypothetical protein
MHPRRMQRSRLDTKKESEIDTLTFVLHFVTEAYTIDIFHCIISFQEEK